MNINKSLLIHDLIVSDYCSSGSLISLLVQSLQAHPPPTCIMQCWGAWLTHKLTHNYRSAAILFRSKSIINNNVCDKPALHSCQSQADQVPFLLFILAHQSTAVVMPACNPIKYDLLRALTVYIIIIIHPPLRLPQPVVISSTYM